MQKGKETAMGKLKIRGCTHCRNGEVFIDHDLYGWYECCLQCGYTHDLPEITQPMTSRNANVEKGAAPELKIPPMPVKKKHPGSLERNNNGL